MVKYKVEYSKRAVKDVKKLKAANLDQKAKALIQKITENPYMTPPPYEKLAGELSGLYSRRINIQHRLVYQVLQEQETIRILSLWSHYENIIHEDEAAYDV